MSINASMIVDVTPRAVRGGSGSLEFNGLVLTKNPLAILAQGFESTTAVGEVFGANSTEYAFAQQYWAADANKTFSPRKIIFSRDLSEPTAAWIRSAPLPDLATLKTITNGSFSISVGNSPVEVTGLSLASVTSYSDAAEAIAAKITGTTGAYDSNLNAFIFTTTATGAEAQIGYATGTDAATLGLSEDAGALLWQGTDAQTPTEMMQGIADIDRNWVTFTTIDEPDNDDAIEFAQWATANFGYIYFPFETSATATVSASTSDLAPSIEEAGAGATAPVYGDVENAAFWMGMIAATDFGATNGMKTYAFKTPLLLPANVTQQGMAETLKSKRYNFIGNYATRNAEFQISTFGTLIDKSYSYIDELAGQIWLANEVQRVCMDGLTTVNRAAYDEQGYTMVRNWIASVVTAGLKNGFIQTGISLSATQKSALTEAVGQDVSKELYTNGYILMVQDPGAEVRAERGSPDIVFYFTYGGAIHKIDIPVTAYF